MKNMIYSFLLVLVLALASCTNPKPTSPHSLKVVKLGSGTTIITSTPEGIDCRENCDFIFPYGKTVKLNVVAAKSSMFTGWDGDCFGSGSCELNMKQDKTVSANAINLVCSNPPNIVDKNLEKLIKATLHKTANLSCTDLKNLKLLEDEDRPGKAVISNLEGLQFASNLELLKLPNNRINNISALATLSKLKKLYLDYNQISNLTPIENLVGLRVLAITHNKIRNLLPLRNFEKLEGLDLNSNMIDDISVLVQNSHITGKDLILDLMGNCLDITGGEDLNNLRILKSRGIDLYYQPQGRCGRQ